MELTPCDVTGATVRAVQVGTERRGQVELYLGGRMEKTWFPGHFWLV